MLADSLFSSRCSSSSVGNSLSKAESKKVGEILELRWKNKKRGFLRRIVFFPSQSETEIAVHRMNIIKKGESFDFRD